MGLTIPSWLRAQVRLKHSKEVVCLAMSDSLVAVGSQGHISLVDPRRKAPVQDVESLDHSHGVSPALLLALAHMRVPRFLTASGACLGPALDGASGDLGVMLRKTLWRFGLC